MRKFILVFILLLTKFVFLYSQDTIFILHIAVGDTIDRKEKMDFDLFPELKCADFKYGIIYSNGDTKKLNAYMQNNSLFTETLDSVTIAQYKANIDKLVEFYSSENQKDSISGSNRKIALINLKNDLSAEKITLNVDKASIKRSAYEGRKKRYLRTNALNSGLSGEKLINAENSGTYGEFRTK
jgi:hypothetical protein